MRILIPEKSQERLLRINTKYLIFLSLKMFAKWILINGTNSECVCIESEVKLNEKYHFINMQIILECFSVFF